MASPVGWTCHPSTSWGQTTIVDGLEAPARCALLQGLVPVVTRRYGLAPAEDGEDHRSRFDELGAREALLQATAQVRNSVLEQDLQQCGVDSLGQVSTVVVEGEYQLVAEDTAGPPMAGGPRMTHWQAKTGEPRATLLFGSEALVWAVDRKLQNYGNEPAQIVAALGGCGAI